MVAAHRFVKTFLLFLAVMGISSTGLWAGNAVGETPDSTSELERRIKQLEIDIQALNEKKEDASRFTFGGYGDFHANFGAGDASDLFDIHRLVFYIGYDFTDWISFSTEIEIEHAFVSSSSGGELGLEQAYFDFKLYDFYNVRVGRVLIPVGIVNAKHEPPTFNGVERSNVIKRVVPSTWFSDGIGIFGTISPELTYEAYVVGGLDGSGFSATSGIRGGRLKERPSFHDPAITARLDYFPFAEREASYGQTLRVGGSVYTSGFDNSNGGGASGALGQMQLYSLDFEYSIADFDMRGELAHIFIDEDGGVGAGTAKEILGWYLEVAYHFMPDSWKEGNLSKADATVFIRYDDYNTQKDMPTGMSANLAGNRSEWTLGVNLNLTPSFVLKTDIQIREDKTSSDLPMLFNLGVGYQF